MARPEFKETPCETPSARYGIIKFGGPRKAVSTGNKDFPAFQERAVWRPRGLFMVPALLQPAVAGSYTSAVASVEIVPSELSTTPPAIKTLPSDNKVAVWFRRATLRLPVALQFPVFGSHNSAVARSVWMPPFKTSSPPTMRTFPSPSRVAV